MLVTAGIVRWIEFVALAGLVGGLAVDWLVLPVREPELDAARRRLRTMRRGVGTVLLLVGVAELWLRAVTMSGGPANAWAAIPVVLTRTHFGAVWTGRVVALLALLPAVGIRVRWARALDALLVLAVALSVSLTGHAADWGDTSAALGLDCLHVVAATTWTGGLFVLGGLLLRDAAGWRVPLLAVVMQRFSRLAGWCLLAVALSGAYSVVMEVPAISALWQTTYGRLLSLKLLLVLGLACGGAVNRYVVLPRLGVGRTSGLPARLFRRGWAALLGSLAGSPASSSRLLVYLAREAALALVIFGCTAALVESTPSRHARHLEHDAAASATQREGHAEPHRAGPERQAVGDPRARVGAPLSW